MFFVNFVPVHFFVQYYRTYTNLRPNVQTIRLNDESESNLSNETITKLNVKNLDEINLVCLSMFNSLDYPIYE